MAELRILLQQSVGHVYLRPYVYSFCQIFQTLRLFPALRVLRTLEKLKE